jgi:hypothetical protein
MTQQAVAWGIILIGWLALPLSAPAQQREEGKEELPPPQVLPSPPVVPPLSPDVVAPSCAPCPARTIAVPRLTLMEQQAATTIPQMRVREEVVGRAVGLDVEYREQKQVVVEWTLKPREIVKDVPCTTMVPVTITDPCTGQCRTEYKSCPVVRQVRLTVYDPVPVERIVVVAVPCLKPGTPLQISKLCVDTTHEPAIATRLQLLAVPNQVHVPPCCALPPAPK